jgi:hypothetical protein
MQVLTTPEHIKLKGTIWPGMNLFDAATQEMQQKRNQKKDASVLRRMERLARLVEPTEVVYSPNGDSILKARHIDDLEDASSLVEGETPIPKAKQVRSRKRKPLADKDVNAPRLVKRKARETGVIPRTYADLPFAHDLPPLPHLQSSSTTESFGASCRYFPVGQEDDIKLAAEPPTARKRGPPQFQIFADGSPSNRMAPTTNGSRNPLQSRDFNGTSFPQIPKVSAAWLQPQQQSGLQFTNPFAEYRPAARQYHAFYEPTVAHENVSPTIEPPIAFREPATNPLSWKSPIRPLSVLSPTGSPFGSLFGMFIGGSPDDDPFVSTKNPLAGIPGYIDAKNDEVKPPTDDNVRSCFVFDEGSSAQLRV